MSEQSPWHQIDHHNDPSSSYELLRAGAEQLASNVIAIAESGEPSDMQDYIHDILADTEQAAPADERFAAFYLLSRGQIESLDQRTLEAGARMLKKLDSNDRTARERLQPIANSLDRGSRETVDTFGQEVGRYFRGHVDIRGASRGHDSTVQTASTKLRGPLETYTGEFDVWRRSQEKEYYAFNEEDKKREAHRRALTAASQVVKPDYEGDQRDLSPLIDPSVERSVATDMLVIIREAQAKEADTKTMLLEYITQMRDTTTPKTIAELIKFTEQYLQGAKSSSIRIGAAVEEIKSKLQSFSSRGTNFRSMTSADEATNLYRYQQRSLNELANGIRYVSGQGNNALNASSETLQRFTQSLALNINR